MMVWKLRIWKYIIHVAEKAFAGKCPFCNAERNIYATDEDKVAQIRKRVEANDAGAMYVLGTYYDQGLVGLLQDREKAIALWTQAAEHGSSRAHFSLGRIYHEGEI
jgi:TPR repeat protein